MKYADKFPDMVPIFDEQENIFRGFESKPCHVCKRITQYIEVNYNVPLCSEECSDKLDRMIAGEIDSHYTPIGVTEDDLDWFNDL